MTKFILKIILFVLPVFICLEIGAMVFRQEKDPLNYMGALADKHQFLQQLSSPKIIVIGDSSLAFGLSARVVSEAVGRPVANMGLHAGLGLDFILGEVRGEVAKNDIVVISTHYYPDEKDVVDGVRCHALDFYPAISQDVSGNILDNIKNRFACDIKRIRRNVMIYFSVISPTKSSVNSKNFYYARDAFNSFGDVRDELYAQADPSLNIRGTELVVADQQETIRQLNDFVRFTASKQAEAVFVYPPMPKSFYEKNSEKIIAFEKLLREKTALTILGTPGEMVYDDFLFYNTVYHLNSQGKRANSAKVANLLKEFISKQQ
jgi:hypothetical protein